MQTRNIAIMLTDIKGFTSKTASFSRAQTQELLARHKDLVLPVILKFHGRLVKTIGDAFLAAFDSPTDAVLCGVEIQQVLRDYNADKDHPEKIEIRIAINSGEVAIHDDGDIYGDPVNITSRLESIAEANEVFFTEAVYLAMNKREVPSSEIGYRQFKGIADKIKVYRVLRETPVGAQPPGAAEALQQPEVPAAAAAPAAAPVPAQPRHSAPPLRRLAALCIDLAIAGFFLVTFSLASCSGDSEKKALMNAIMREAKQGKFEYDPKVGVKYTAPDGQVTTVSKDGETITGPAADQLRKVVEKAARKSDDGPDFPLPLILWIFYCALMMKRAGATVGMKALRLRVVDSAAGGPLRRGQAFWRALFSLVSACAGLLGYLWALWDKDGLTWHDLVAGTRVIPAD